MKFKHPETKVSSNQNISTSRNAQGACKYVSSLQKQLPEVFCKKRCSQKFRKINRKHLCQSLFFKKVADLYREIYVFSPNAEKCRSITLLKKSLWYRCFPVNLRIFQEHLFYRRPPDNCFCRFCLSSFRIWKRLSKKITNY